MVSSGAAAPIGDDGRTLLRSAVSDERVALAGTEHFFSDTAGEFAIFLVAITIGLIIACSAPLFLDFVLATCRAPRNRRSQIVKLTTGLLVFLAFYLAFALIQIPLATFLLASSIFSLPITLALQPLLVPYFAGFWLQATTIFEEHHRVRIEERDLVIIALGTFSIEAREYSDVTTLSDNGRTPQYGTDDAGRPYADKTVFVPNDTVLRSIVTAWWRNPRATEPIIVNRTSVLSANNGVTSSTTSSTYLSPTDYEVRRRTLTSKYKSSH